MGAIVNGTIVTWNGVVVKDVASIDPDFAQNMVDCSTLDNTQVDNRNGIENPSCTMVVSLKDGNRPLFAEGDHGELSVTLPSVPAQMMRLRCSNVTGGGGSDDPNNLTYSFVSTEEEPEGT